MDGNVRLTIEIKNKHPVELADLAKSMASFADEYRRFVGRDAHFAPDDVKLYVKEIRSGSIVQELVALAPYALPFAEHAKTIIDYAKWLKELLDWYVGRSEEKPRSVEKNTLQNLSYFVEPVAKDHGAQANIGAINFNGDVAISFNFNSTDANAAQNALRRELDSMREPVTGLHEQVVMYWAQARNQTDNKAGDKARIESIYAGDVKVTFSTIGMKTKMLHDEPFAFKRAFVVDVAVETIEGRPVLYRVLNLHEVIDREE